MTNDNCLLVTVGSTSFSALTDFITKPEILTTLHTDLNLDAVIVQHGTHPPPPHHTTPRHKPTLQTFDYTPSLHTLMSSASVIVSHAGAGTILEVVDMRKPLVVVVNSTLMDDHQTELATAMERCHCCEVVTNADIETKLIPAIRRALSPQRPEPQPVPRVTGIFHDIVCTETANVLASRRRPSS